MVGVMCVIPTVHELDGDHYTLLQEPNVSELANTLVSLLDRTLKRTQGSQSSTMEILENE